MVTRDGRKQAPLTNLSSLLRNQNIYKDLVMRSCSTLVLRPGRSSDIPRCCTPPLCAAARSGHIEDNYVQPQVINAVAIRRQRPFRAATAGDDNLIVFHQGKCCYFVRLRTKLLNTKKIPGAPYRYDKARHSPRHLDLPSAVVAET